MSRHAKASKSKHAKTPDIEDVKVYVPKGKLPDEQSAELTHESNDRKRRGAVHERQFSMKKVWLVIVAAILLAAAWMLPAEGLIGIACLLIPYVLVAVDVYFDAFESVLAGKYLSKDICVVVASLVAFCIGRGAEGAFVVILYRAGDLLEAIAREKTQKASTAIMDAKPYGANLEQEDGIINILPEDVRVGDVIAVYPGDCIPVDGEIIEGITSVDTSALTGSGRLVTLREGMRAVSGCINKSKTIRVKVSAAYEDSTFTKVLHLADEAKDNISRQESFVSAASKLCCPIMLGLGLVFALVPPIFSGDWSEWIGRGLTFFIAANFSGLLTGVTIAFAGALNNAYYRGIFFKGTRYVEALAKSETMVFNKTGTITDGIYVISDVVPEKISEHELLTLAATVEMFSDHPIARALKDACGMLDQLDSQVTQAQELPGRGISAFINGRLVYVGNALLFEEHSLKYKIPNRSGTAIHVSMDGRYCGHIILSDKVREGAFDALEALRVQGIKNMVMLTSDLRTPAKTTASSLNFDMVKAELMPENKVSAVEYLMATLADDAMLACVGDAIDDATVLRRANVGIAMGALTENTALETGNVAIMASDLKKLPIAYSIAKKSFLAAKTSIYVVFGAKALIIVLGILGLIPLWAAVLVDTAVSAATLLNSLRLLKRGDI